MTNQRVGRLGVIGGGTMGAGIAQVAIVGSLTVTLVEQTAERADGARQRVATGLDKLLKKGTLSLPDRDASMERLSCTSKYDDLSDVDMVVEAVFEDLVVKQGVASELGRVLAEDAVFASNTSSISIDRIAAAFPRPEQVIGIHFFNPVPVLSLVEVVVGDLTSQATVDLAESLAHQLGKTPIRVADRPGFVVNRLLIPMINEAARLVGEGVADVEAVDTAMRLGASHPMGPLALADLIGIDVCLAIMETLAADLDAHRFEPAPLLRQLVADGKLGRKTGEGFHIYAR